MTVNLLDIVLREMKLRNYSPKTIEAYTRVIKDAHAFFRRPLREVGMEEIKVANRHGKIYKKIKNLLHTTIATPQYSGQLGQSLEFLKN